MGTRTRQQHTLWTPRRRTAENATRSFEGHDAGQQGADLAECAAWGIPVGYSIKNWDREEVPIVLLGSVFDANSLGKWIYDWTVYRCGGGGSPMGGMAGDL